ncbi:MAG: hypothetical protein AN484_22730 [Aphanizomenon flos-aquae WA102]|jgi:hypothetical protein|uniref:Uncharacterized protein n=1 Tax=Aphanizomenon flos-aquae WA102 TaxID=1710896 RepID=A0A1B7WSS9_APHFL|nr:MAG: hypothetical protein AN484_22730 [Aphanizomenon flos-aquae WA102]
MIAYFTNNQDDLLSLILLNTSLTASSILKLANIENLAEVTFIEDKNDLLSITKQLKSQKPDCLIKLNHQIITDTFIS